MIVVTLGCLHLCFLRLELLWVLIIMIVTIWETEFPFAGSLSICPPWQETGQIQELGTQFRSPTWVTGSQFRGPSPASQGAQQQEAGVGSGSRNSMQALYDGMQTPLPSIRIAPPNVFLVPVFGWGSSFYHEARWRCTGEPAVRMTAALCSCWRTCGGLPLPSSKNNLGVDICVWFVGSSLKAEYVGEPDTQGDVDTGSCLHVCT